jgi:hypothetical protein
MEAPLVLDHVGILDAVVSLGTPMQPTLEPFHRAGWIYEGNALNSARHHHDRRGGS